MHIVYVWNSKLQMQRGIINELLEPFKKKNKHITKNPKMTVMPPNKHVCIL